MKCVKVSPLSRVAPVIPAPAMRDSGRPGTLSSAKAQSMVTSIASRNPAPATVPLRAP